MHTFGYYPMAEYGGRRTGRIKKTPGIFQCIRYLLKNDFISACGTVWKSVTGVPMGGNAASRISSLTAYFAEREPLAQIKRDIAGAQFFRYADDITTRLMNSLSIYILLEHMRRRVLRWNTSEAKALQEPSITWKLRSTSLDRRMLIKMPGQPITVRSKSFSRKIVLCHTVVRHLRFLARNSNWQTLCAVPITTRRAL